MQDKMCTPIFEPFEPRANTWACHGLSTLVLTVQAVFLLGHGNTDKLTDATENATLRPYAGGYDRPYVCAYRPKCLHNMMPG